MKLTQLCEDLNLEFEGDGEIEIKKVCGLDNLSEGGIGFITNLASVQRVEEHNISKKLEKQILNMDKIIMIQPHDLKSPFKNRIYSKDPLVTHVTIAEVLNPPVKSSGKIDESVFLGENVDVADGVTIDPKTVIYDNVKIGEGTIIRAGVVIMEGSVIGDNCLIYPNVVVRDNCVIGNNVILHPNCVIGGDGHGYYQRDGKNYKIPQVGRVILEDFVEIGSCTAVDRGRLEDTIISEGTKIDNHVQVAHNVEIGKHSLISGNSVIGGSVKIGNNLIMGGHSAIADNRTIGNNVIISGGSGVAGNVRDNTMIGGIPARPYKRWQQSVANIGNLGNLRKKVQKLEKKIEELIKK